MNKQDLKSHGPGCQVKKEKKKNDKILTSSQPRFAGYIAVAKVLVPYLAPDNL